MNDYKKEEWLLNLPLYMAEEIGNIVEKERNDKGEFKYGKRIWL